MQLKSIFVWNRKIQTSSTASRARCVAAIVVWYNFRHFRSQTRETLTMDTSHRREGELDILNSDTDAQPTDHVSNTSASQLGSRLQVLSLDDNAQVSNETQLVKLYKHVEGKWELQDKLISYEFIREGYKGEDEEGEEEEGEDDDGRVDKNKGGFRSWVLKMGSKVRGRVDNRLQMKFYVEQLRVDFANQGVWAFKFMSREGYKDFVAEFQNYMFENTYLLEATEENKVKVFGKNFMGWANPQTADDSVWEDKEESSGMEEDADRDLKEELEEAAHVGILSLAMGALDHSFLVSETGIEAVKNSHHGIHGKGMSVSFRKGELGGDESSYVTPKKGLLMTAETNMMLMSPSKKAEPHAAGVHQVDIETGKVVTEWKFEKDGTPIMMRDITNDSKGAQLDASESTFMGLDDNRLCRWDMRDKYGIVQETETGNTVLSWADGHQFSRGTNFQCFATTGDGCVVVGSSDGKIRLYGKTSMRMAKTAFPGLGSPITHVDVTYDGKWIIGTTDTYLILISTVFTDKDGKTKTGFSGRMGHKIPAPRLLKLNPVHADLAGNNKFHGGQFSWVTESGKQERHLVAAVDKFSVIWNFRHVKNSDHGCYKGQEGLKSCYCYKMVSKDESIVDNKFMHDKFALTNSPEAPLVVATPKKVSSFSIAP